MLTINFVTSNDYKFAVAKKAFQNSNIKILQKKLDVPEIQNVDLEKIAAFSAKWACEKLNEPLAVTDAGFYIGALNDFPGPFIKFMNHYLNADDILNLMREKKNRACTFKDALAFCRPGEAPISFLATAKGTIALKKGKKGKTPSNEIFIPEGYSVPQSDIPHDEMLEFWKGNQENWKKLAKKLST